jgi:hypothetical protein
MKMAGHARKEKILKWPKRKIDFFKTVCYKININCKKFVPPKINALKIIKNHHPDA